MRQSLNTLPRPPAALADRFWLGYARPALWMGLLALSIVVLLYPVRLTLDYDPIQSAIALPNLPLFAGLFYLWFAMLLGLLLWSPGKSHWEDVALLTVFSVTSMAIWITATQGQMRESPFYAAQIDYLKETHKITQDIPNFRYFQWPGTFILTASLSEVTGLTTWNSIMAVQLLWNALFAAFLYLFFLKVTGSRHFTWLGVLLVLLGGTLIYKMLQQFHPGTFGLLLFLIGLTLVVPYARSSRYPLRNCVLIVIVLMATAMTHFVSALTLFLVFAGLTGLHYQAQRKALELGVAALALAVPLMWLAYVAVIPGPEAAAPNEISQPAIVEPTFGATRTALGGLRETGESALVDVASGDVAPRGPLRFFADFYFGTRSPVWASAIRVLWIAVLYLLGGFLVLRSLRRLRRSEQMQQIMVGMAIGIGALGIGSYLASRGEDAIRVLAYAPLVLVPISIRFVQEFKETAKSAVFAGLVALALALSLPSFLSNNNTINVNNYNRAPEQEAGRFLAKTFGNGTGVQIHGEAYPWLYYLPFATFRFPHPYYVGFSEEKFLKAIATDATSFADGETAAGKATLWVDTKRDILDMHLLLGVDLSQSKGWRDIGRTLGETSHVYDNGDVRFYLNE